MSLADEIASALAAPATDSAALAGLHVAAVEALPGLQEAAAAAERRALAPTLTAADALEAERSALAANFAARRMAAAVEALAEARDRRAAAEAESARLALRAAAEAEAAAVAKRIGKEWPALSGQLLSLIAAIVAAERAVEAANAARAGGEPDMLGPEELARREAGGMIPPSIGVPAARIVELVVPDLRLGKGAAWPPGWHPGNRYREPLDYLWARVKKHGV